MTNRTAASPADTSQRGIAKIAGFGWLLIIAAGVFAEFFVRSTLIIPGDAAATANNITASEGLFRLGIAGDLVMLLADVGVALALYVLLRPVNRGLALLAAFLRLMQAAVLGANLLNLVAASLLLSGTGYLATFEPGQLHALALMALEAHAVGYDLGLVFFAFALFILGYLFFKSGYVPRVLAVLLSLSGLVYLTGSLVAVLAPVYAPVLEPAYFLPFVAELSLALWLLFRGINVQQASASASPSLQAG